MLAEQDGKRSAERPKRLWIVDQDEEYRAALRDFLECTGLAALELDDLGAALRSLVSKAAPAPALIIINLCIPQLPGWELLTMARSYCRLERIPVIVLSSSAQRSVRRYKPEDFLSRPTDPQKLMRLVKTKLEEKEPVSSPENFPVLYGGDTAREP